MTLKFEVRVSIGLVLLAGILSKESGEGDGVHFSCARHVTMIAVG